MPSSKRSARALFRDSGTLASTLRAPENAAEARALLDELRAGLAAAADALVWKGTRRVELDFDGQGQVDPSVDGKQVLDRSCGTLRTLDVFLTIMTEAEMTLDDLVLEGVPDAEALEPPRHSTVARGLEALGR